MGFRTLDWAMRRFIPGLADFLAAALRLVGQVALEPLLGKSHELSGAFLLGANIAPAFTSLAYPGYVRRIRAVARPFQAGVVDRVFERLSAEAASVPATAKKRDRASSETLFCCTFNISISTRLIVAQGHCAARWVDAVRLATRELCEGAIYSRARKILSQRFAGTPTEPSK